MVSEDLYESEEGEWDDYNSQLKDVFFKSEPEFLSKRSRLYYTDYNIKDSTKYLDEKLAPIS